MASRSTGAEDRATSAQTAIRIASTDRIKLGRPVEMPLVYIRMM
jgi:hypothetical protein